MVIVFKNNTQIWKRVAITAWTTT